MRTTIDAAGRIVVPKALRDEMGLSAGRAVDIQFSDGRLEIELAPAEVDLLIEDGLPVLRPRAAMPDVSQDVVRATLESVRR
jgi:AbrB family looped-hinge helix DNA binding protein